MSKIPIRDIAAFLAASVMGVSSLLVSYSERTTHLQKVMYDISWIGIVFILSLMLMIKSKGNAQYVWLLAIIFTAVDIVNVFMNGLKINIWHYIALYFLGIIITLIVKRYGSTKE